MNYCLVTTSLGEPDTYQFDRFRQLNPDTLLSKIPYFCETTPNPTGKHYPRDQAHWYEKIEFMAKLRNEATATALEKFPETTHVLNVESWYLNFAKSLNGLLEHYEEADADIILGSPVFTWAWTRIRYTEGGFYDSGATPECALLNVQDFRQMPAYIQVGSIGSCFIFPVKTWLEHPFHNDPSDPIGKRFFYTIFGQESGLPVLIDNSAWVWRAVRYPWINRIRCSLALGTRLRWLAGFPHWVAQKIDEQYREDCRGWCIQEHLKDE